MCIQYCYWAVYIFGILHKNYAFFILTIWTLPQQPALTLIFNSTLTGRRDSVINYHCVKYNFSRYKHLNFVLYCGGGWFPMLLASKNYYFWLVQIPKLVMIFNCHCPPMLDTVQADWIADLKGQEPEKRCSNWDCGGVKSLKFAAIFLTSRPFTENWFYLEPLLGC